jgi:multiple sugar transport system substrate-binding protein
MAPGKKSPDGRVPASRRTVVKGLGAAGAALSGMLPRWSFADAAAGIYADAAIDWKEFAGQTIALAGAIHPWSSAITPLLAQFTELTGIKVVTDFRLETEFLGALPDKLASGSTTPDTFMFLTYGQGISAGWLEPLNAFIPTGR